MEAIETEVVRRRMPERLRMNLRESGDAESWHRRALIRYSDVVRACGEEPNAGYCESTRCSDRRPCDDCYERSEWELEVCSEVMEVSGWGLYSFGLNSAFMTGRPFAHRPNVYRHVRHPGVVVVSWSGGLDI